MLNITCFQFRRDFFSLEFSVSALRLREGVSGVSSEGASLKQYGWIDGVGSWTN